LQATRQEVPHAVATYIENWEVEGSLTRVSAVILVETEGQKAIIIGQKGKMLKAIGTKARLDIEAMTGTKVYLELFVKVRTNWRGNMKLLHELELV
jgi:GTP-binding protein Era